MASDSEESSIPSAKIINYEDNDSFSPIFHDLDSDSNLTSKSDSDNDDESTNNHSENEPTQKLSKQKSQKNTQDNSNRTKDLSNNKSISSSSQTSKKCDFCKTKKIFVTIFCSSCREHHHICSTCYDHKDNYKKGDEFMCYPMKNVCFDCGKYHDLSEKGTSVDECGKHNHIWCIRKKGCGKHNVCGQCEEDLLLKYKNKCYPVKDPNGKVIKSYKDYKFYDSDDETVCKLKHIKKLEKKVSSPKPKRRKRSNPPVKSIMPMSKPIFHKKKKTSTKKTMKTKSSSQLTSERHELQERKDSWTSQKKNIPNIKIMREGFPVAGPVNFTLRCLIARYFTKEGTEKEKDDLVDDMFSSLINYGIISIFEKIHPLDNKKIMKATAIVERHHIKTLINPNDENDNEDVNCAVIHYIATNPTHLGISDDMFVIALLKEIVNQLKTDTPKIKYLYIVTKSNRYEVLDTNDCFDTMGFESNDLVQIDNQEVKVATMNKKFYDKLDLYDTDDGKIGPYVFQTMLPQNYTHLLVKKYKDKIGVTSCHEYLHERNMDDFETTLLNKPLIKKIKEAIATLESSNETEIKIPNNRAGALSSSTTDRACAWKAAIMLVEIYDADKAERMKQSLSFDPDTYNDLLFFRKENSLCSLLDAFNLRLKRPTYSNSHTKKPPRVTQKEYKSFVMNAESGLFICLLQNSDKCQTHAVGIDARNKHLYDPATSSDKMELNEDSLKKCCNGLDCIAFTTVGMLS